MTVRTDFLILRPHSHWSNAYLLPWQPRGLILARIEGPITEEVTVSGRGECGMTHLTDVKYPPGSTESLQNHWLLIGTHTTTQGKKEG